MTENNQFLVKGQPVHCQPNTILSTDFISLTDIARIYNAMIHPKVLINDWMRLKNTLEALAEWELRYNPNFKGFRSETFKNDNGVYNSANIGMSPQQWVKLTNAIGIYSIPGRYNSGTYAHETIALMFAAWLSPSLRVDVYESFIEFKRQQDMRYNIMRDVQRDACRKECTMFNNMVQEYVDPYVPNAYFAHATNADLHNYLVFGTPAVTWRIQHPEEHANNMNMRDFATTQQLEELRYIQALDSFLVARGFTLEQRANILYIKLNNMRNIPNPPPIVIPQYDHNQQFTVEVKTMYTLIPTPNEDEE